MTYFFTKCTLSEFRTFVDIQTDMNDTKTKFSKNIISKELSKKYFENCRFSSQFFEYFSD